MLSFIIFMRTETAKRVIVCFVAYTFWWPIHSQALENQYTIEDGGYRRAFQVATNEVFVQTQKGDRGFRNIKGVHNAEALRRYAKKKSRSTADDYELVLYERGAKRNEYTRRVVTKKVLVTLMEETDVASLAKRVGVSSWQAVGFTPGRYIFYATEIGGALEMAEVLRTEPDVRSAEPMLGKKIQNRFVPNDPLFTNQWHLLNTGQFGGTPGIDANITNVWNTYLGSNIVIGIIDDGLQTTHPDLSANVNTNIDYDFNDDDNNPDPDLTVDDSHGTSVAGVAAGRGNNALGISGAAPLATLVGLRLTASSFPAATDDQIADAMSHSNDLIHIKNNSWGPFDDGITLEGPDVLTQEAFSNGVTMGRGGRGTIYVWAGGNGAENGDNANYDGYANSIYTVAIAAIGNDGIVSVYSEDGACLVGSLPSNIGLLTDTAAITTTDLVGTDGDNSGDYTDAFGGTSSSAPLASGIIALMLEANPDLGWRDVQEILIRTARQNDPGDTEWTNNAAGFHFNHHYGAGLIDAQAAVTAAETWTNLGAHTSYSSAQTNLSVSIPDFDTNGITRTFSMTSGFLRIEHVAVTVNITHPYRGDVEVLLTAPGGMTSLLAPEHGDFNADYSDWTFMSTRHWGETMQGTWTLQIADLGELDEGTLNSAIITFYGTADQDGDTIDDDWEQTFFGTLAAANASSDNDGDDFIDLHEFLAGTIPTNAASLLAFTVVSNAPASNLTIQWPSATNRSYRILQTTNLFTSFENLATNLAATPPTNTYTDTSVTNLIQRMYRIELE